MVHNAQMVYLTKIIIADWQVKDDVMICILHLIPRLIYFRTESVRIILCADLNLNIFNSLLLYFGTTTKVFRLNSIVTWLENYCH